MIKIIFFFQPGHCNVPNQYCKPLGDAKSFGVLEVDHWGLQQGQGIKLVRTPYHPPLPHSDQQCPEFHLRVHDCMIESRVNYFVIEFTPFFQWKTNL